MRGKARVLPNDTILRIVKVEIWNTARVEDDGELRFDYSTKAVGHGVIIRMGIRVRLSFGRHDIDVMFII